MKEKGVVVSNINKKSALLNSKRLRVASKKIDELITKMLNKKTFNYYNQIGKELEKIDMTKEAYNIYNSIPKDHKLYLEACLNIILLAEQIFETKPCEKDPKNRSPITVEENEKITERLKAKAICNYN